MKAKIILQFDKGTLVLKGFPQNESSFKGVKWDPRTNSHRAEAYRYGSVITALVDDDYEFADFAVGFTPIRFNAKQDIIPRAFQKEALQAWKDSAYRGVVVLPTGAGKTILALLAIRQCNMPALIHVPTIDLMHQWYEVLTQYFDQQIGLLGGGYNDLQSLTVATYDSALIHVSYHGNKFGLTVFDECHHLPGNQFKYAAISSIAPLRLGLTATPERTDGKEKDLFELVGDICYRANIRDLPDAALAPYDVVTVGVRLSNEERRLYEEVRNHYTGFLRRKNINVASPGGWRRFLWSTRSLEGREAFKAYLAQKKLSEASAAKLQKLWDLIQNHSGDRVLVFTQENEMAYEIGRKFYFPVLTHHTKVKERKAFLDNFRKGAYSVLVTSKVLNEGVDVPEANVAIVLSGSGSVREHVQRLGRILRSRPGKRAVLYEVISEDTGEQFVNQRRRKHSAYRRKRYGG